MEKEKLRWILQGVLLLSEGCTEAELIKDGIPRQYINQIRATYNFLNSE